MGHVIWDVLAGAALLVFALIAAIILIPVLVILSITFHAISWFISAVFSLLLVLFVLWGIGFLYRKVKESRKNRSHAALR
jgi:hypothetical protein